MVYWAIPLFASISNVLLAIFVARAPTATRLTRAFIFLSVMFALWNMTFFALFFFDDYSTALLVSKFFRVGAAFMPAAALQFVFSLRKRSSRLWLLILVGNYAVASGLTVANFLDLFVSGLHRFEWGYYSVPGPAYDVFTAYLLFNVAVALGVLTFDYRSVDDARIRNQLRFWLLGAAIAIPLGCTNLLPAYGIQFYPLGNLGNTAWAAVVAYAIVRHRLMDIDLLVIKGAAFVISCLFLLFPVLVVLIWSQRILLGRIDLDFSLLIACTLLIVAIAFPRIRYRLEPGLYASIFPEKREYRRALVSFTDSIRRILVQDTLIRELASNLHRNFNLSSVVVVLIDATTSELEPAYTLGREPESLNVLRQPQLLELLRNSEGPLLTSELREFAHPRSYQEIGSEFLRNSWEVCVPLRVGNRLFGFIALGRRAGLAAFSALDLEILDALGAETSISLENARLYSELKQSQDIIRRADRSSAMGTLAAGIAHEIRNPLVSIQTFFQLAPDRLHDEEFSTTFLETAASEVRRISNLINELLAFARSPTTEFGPTDLGEVVRGAFVLLSAEARKHRLSLSSHLQPDVPAVLGNFEQLRQVLINLLFNAIQASNPGGSIVVSVRRSQYDGIGFGQLEVRDTGSGIPADNIDRLFDPFFTTKATGTGLGLSIVQRIVEEHGGRISVTSTMGTGTCFAIDIPLTSDGTESTNTIDPSGIRQGDIV